MDNIADVEMAFISCLLSKPDLLTSVSAKIKPEMLVCEMPKAIYSAMVDMVDYNTPKLADKVGCSFKELLDLEELVKVASPSVLDSYGAYILENYKKNQMKCLTELNPTDARQKIDEILSLEYFEGPEVDVSAEFLKSVEERYNGDEDKRSVLTGFRNLDDKIYGFRKSELIIIGGRPASGKTTFGMNVAYNMAMQGKKVLFCSLEMGKIELHERLVKSITKINNYRAMSLTNFEEVVETSRVVKNLPLVIFDKPNIVIEDVFSKASKIKPDILFVDHLSILKTAKYFKNRYEEVSYLSAQLKALARQLDIPVVCLCQLNRALEGREIKAPTLADLRDSGSIEQDADLVCFVYRPEYHLMQQEPDDKSSQAYTKWLQDMQETRGKAQIILAKNRRGLLDKFKFSFDGANYSFYERDE